MHTRKLFLRCGCALLAGLLLVGGLAGCAAKSSAADEGSYIISNTAQNAGAYEFFDVSTDAHYEGGAYYGDAAASPMDGLGAGGGLSVPADGRKVIMSAEISLEAKEYDEALQQLIARLQEVGGYIAGREDYDYYSRECYLQLRVPSGQFAAFVGGLGDIANVTRCSQYQEDVTDSYIETQSYLDSLQTQQQRLLELMEEAASLEEMLAIEDRLAEVRARLQYFDSLKNSYDSRIAYADIEVRLHEVRDYTVVQPSFGQRLQSALAASGRGFVRFLQDLLFFFIDAGPYLIILALILWPLLRFGKKRRAARKAARAQRQAQKAAGASDDAAAADDAHTDTDAPQA